MDSLLLASLSSQFHAIMVLDDYSIEFGVRWMGEGHWVSCSWMMQAGRLAGNPGVPDMMIYIGPLNINTHSHFAAGVLPWRI
jgi:hypothetical protein